MMNIPANPPLTGTRVLDFGHIVAAPFCTRILADLGADVAKIETSLRKDYAGGSRLKAVDDIRDRPPAYLSMNRNKRSITINLKTNSGHALITRLVEVADVVVENFSGGVMDRLGLGYDRLRAVNPRLIFVSMSGYGHKGPRQSWRSMNLNLQAYSGLMLATGNEGDPPVAISNSWNDFVGGLHACFGILEALADRQRTGLGAYLDLSQFECSVASLGPLLYATSQNRDLPPRTGNRSTVAAPQGCYRCAGEDKWCVISVENDEQWRALVGALGSPSWAGDVRFDSVTGRLSAHDKIDEHLERWTKQRNNTEVESLLRGAGVPAERVRNIDDIVDSSHDRGIFRVLKYPSGSSRLVTGLPFTFSHSPLACLSPAPLLGEHNREILRDWLRLSDGEIADLEDQGALR
ncbi:MAG: CoA transferase [Deltaproteobacteria bacterium]|nr:CoA transferase [Deltaproteobacteria bacterium]